jgi:signal transduction histidine kinase
METKMKPRVIKVLLVEDDEDDYVIIRDVLAEIEGQYFELDWVSTHEEAIETATLNRHDVCLMDYRLGQRDGIQLAGDFLRRCNFQAPIILLTGLGSHDVDVRAMQQGVADYLEKNNLTPDLLERSIRYAIERLNTLAALQESEHQIRLLSAKLLEAQENERRIIAQELHDSVGASLTAVRYGLEEKIYRMGKDSPPPEGVSLEQIIPIVRDTIEEIHRISSNLRPSVLDDMGLLAAIRSDCRKLQKVYKGIQIETRIDVEEAEVPESLKINIYRVLQEALNNAFKHSGGDTVHVSLKSSGRFLEISIRDNGRGFDAEAMLDPEGKRVGMGLLGMKERTELSNGAFELRSEKGQGTVVKAKWPIC